MKDNKHAQCNTTRHSLKVLRSTLESLLFFVQLAFEDKDLEAIYLLTDGKPDTSTSLVLREVARMNLDRNITVNTISFNCSDRYSCTSILASSFPSFLLFPGHDSLSKTTLQGTLEGWRCCGRQRKYWMDNIKESSAHARTAHKGHLQKRLEQDLC